MSEEERIKKLESEVKWLIETCFVLLELATTTMIRIDPKLSQERRNAILMRLKP